MLRVRLSGALRDSLATLALDACAGHKMRVRAFTFGYLQRSFPVVVSEVDACEAGMLVDHAVKHAAKGGKSGSVFIQRFGNLPYTDVCFITLPSVAHEAIRMKDNAPDNGIISSWIGYAALLAGELPKMGRLQGLAASMKNPSHR